MTKCKLEQEISPLRSVLTILKLSKFKQGRCDKIFGDSVYLFDTESLFYLNSLDLVWNKLNLRVSFPRDRLRTLKNKISLKVY